MFPYHQFAGVAVAHGPKVPPGHQLSIRATRQPVGTGNRPGAKPRYSVARRLLGWLAGHIGQLGPEHYDFDPRRRYL